MAGAPDRGRPRRLFGRMALTDKRKAAAVAVVMTAVCLALVLLLWPRGDEVSGRSGQDEIAGNGSAGGERVADAVSTTATTVGSAPVPGVAGAGVGEAAVQAPEEITIAAIGDVMGDQTVRWGAWDAEAGRYDFWPTFRPVAPYLQQADYAVCNLETRFAGVEAGYVGFRVFNSPSELGAALFQSGVDLAATANNHTLDMGWQGIVGTLDRLDEIGLAHVGTYRSLEDKTARSPFLVDIKGIKVAFLNYTVTNNGLYLSPEHKSFAVNFFNMDKVAEEAGLARSRGADVVIAVLHFGEEFERRPNGRQITISVGTAESEGLLARGVDVILGAHPHVVQPIVRVTRESDSGEDDGYVVYSLGNFLSGNRQRYSDSGIIAYVHITKADGRTRVTGISYLPLYVQMTLDGEDTDHRILPVLPGLVPQTDTTVGEYSKERIGQVWAELDGLLRRPEDNIMPLDLKLLGMAPVTTAISGGTGD